MGLQVEEMVDGKGEIFKVRLIGKCLSQKEEINNEKTFSSVAMLKSVHTLVAIC